MAFPSDTVTFLFFLVVPILNIFYTALAIDIKPAALSRQIPAEPAVSMPETRNQTDLSMTTATTQNQTELKVAGSANLLQMETKGQGTQTSNMSGVAAGVLFRAGVSQQSTPVLAPSPGVSDVAAPLRDQIAEMREQNAMLAKLHDTVRDDAAALSQAKALRRDAISPRGQSLAASQVDATAQLTRKAMMLLGQSREDVRGIAVAALQSAEAAQAAAKQLETAANEQLKVLERERKAREMVARKPPISQAQMSAARVNFNVPVASALTSLEAGPSPRQSAQPETSVPLPSKPGDEEEDDVYDDDEPDVEEADY